MQTWLLYMALGAEVAGCYAAPPPSGHFQSRPLQLMIRLEELADDAAPLQRQQQLDRLIADSSPWPGVRLCWLRSLAVGGEVVRVQGLASGQQAAFVQWLAGQPGVAYVEVDGPMEVGPGPRLPGTRMGAG